MIRFRLCTFSGLLPKYCCVLIASGTICFQFVESLAMKTSITWWRCIYQDTLLPLVINKYFVLIRENLITVNILFFTNFQLITGFIYIWTGSQISILFKRLWSVMIIILMFKLCNIWLAGVHSAWFCGFWTCPQHSLIIFLLSGTTKHSKLISSLLCS